MSKTITLSGPPSTADLYSRAVTAMLPVIGKSGPVRADAVLPDGTRIRSIGLASGDRFVTTITPDGVVRSGFRPAGQRAGQPGAASRTTYNPRTGITSTWTTQADGTRVGVHVDRQGNRSVSTSR